MNDLDVFIDRHLEIRLKIRKIKADTERVKAETRQTRAECAVLERQISDLRNGVPREPQLRGAP